MKNNSSVLLIFSIVSLFTSIFALLLVASIHRTTRGNAQDLEARIASKSEGKHNPGTKVTTPFVAITDPDGRQSIEMFDIGTGPNIIMRDEKGKNVLWIARENNRMTLSIRDQDSLYSIDLLQIVRLSGGTVKKVDK